MRVFKTVNSKCNAGTLHQSNCIWVAMSAQERGHGGEELEWLHFGYLQP